MTPDEGVRRYFEAELPSSVRNYHPESDDEDMKDLATGLIGAMLKLKLPSLSGPELGSDIPLVVLYIPGDLIRILVDPHIKKEQYSYRVTALSYTGEFMLLDTSDVMCEDIGAMEANLEYHADLLNRLRSAS